MILHRLRLTNFRGISDREIAFPEHGVVVVCGPNEVGKSSMLEALDLLLDYKDRSANQKIKQVKPTHADVGAEVEAEISTGPYRFVYRKRFHKKCLTELTVIEPARRQHSGDEAHELVRAMLAETVDIKLWEAQRVLQAAPTAPVDLSGSDALSRALDAAAGEAVAAGGTESLLIDRIEAEFERYFTPVAGKPAKEFKEAIDRVTAAEEQLARCRAAVADVEERVRRHEELTAELRQTATASSAAAERLSAARLAYRDVSELAEQVAQARLVATAATATSVTSALADTQRRQLIADLERRTVTVAELHAGLVAAEQQAAAARQTAHAAAQSAERSAAALVAAQRRLDAARAAAEACVARDDASRLVSRLQRIEETGQRLGELAVELAAITITDDLLAEIDRRSAGVERLRAQLDAAAGTVEFTALADLNITVDGVQRTLAAGQVLVEPASAPFTVDVPGVISVRIDPGATTVRLQSDFDAAQIQLAQLLAETGTADTLAARALNERRRELEVSRGQLTVALDMLLDGDDVEGLRSRLAELRAAAETAAPDVGAEAAAAELAAADRDLNAVRADAEARQQSAAESAAALAEKTTQATVQNDRMRSAEAELEAVRERLIAERAVATDEALAVRAVLDGDAQQRADAALSGLSQRYEAADPDAVGAELAAAEEAAARVTREHDAVKQALHDLTVELGVIGSEGRQGQLDEAESELERARTDHNRIGARAAAVKMLRDTMTRHRDITRQRYVRPYRTELERLGRIVFGPSLEVEVNTGLSILARTLGGRTVPYESLSGGAREQLGVLARLAGAALVAAEDTVPVVIDDALGFSDPDRLARMAAVFGTVGDRGQVIVLTCQPSRYADVADAQFIELSA